MSGNLSDASNKLGSMTEEDKSSLYESSRTDSGFISSGNLLISGEIVSEEIHPERKSPTFDSGIIDVDPKNPDLEHDPMKLDSGVDLCLTESFSSLSLKTSGLNNLNSGSIKSSNVSPPATKQNVPEKQPWEVYYEQDEDGNTYLHEAILQGFPEVALALIRTAPVPRLLDTANDDAQTPLHLAVATGHWKIVRWLIVAGARPCPRNLQGDSPLHLAARMGDIYCCKAIVDPVQHQERDVLGLEYSPQTYQSCDLNQWNYDGQTSVHVAAINGHVDVLRHLVWYGADINAREGKSGYTALHYAVQRDDEKLAKFLLECNKLDADTVTYGGRTVLEIGYPVTEALVSALRARGVPSPYSSDEEYDDDDSDEEMMFETTNMFQNNLVINASA